MNNKKNIVGWVALIIAIIALFTPIAGKSIAEKSFGGITNYDSLTLGVNQAVAYLPTQPNAVGISTQNGVSQYTAKESITAGTTTPCSILSPAATTTLDSFAFNLTTGTSTSIGWTLATSTSPNATTSPILKFPPVGAGAQATLAWAAGANNALISPSTFVNVGSEALPYGSAGGVAGIIGTCQGIFQTTQ